MILNQAGLINYYQFNSFKDAGIINAVFTRLGGISPAPWESLNFGASVGDEIDRVKQNKQLAFSTLGIDPASIYEVYQVHSSSVVRVDRPKLPGELHLKADAMITNKPGVFLTMRFADCVPIYLFDTEKRAIAIAHAGWIGTINKIVAKTVEMMKISFKTDPKKLIAALGPSIGPDHYAVRSDVIQEVKSAFHGLEQDLLIERENGRYLDLWKANELVLHEAGVESIENAEMCTFCNSDLFYSHRAEQGRTGRFGAVFGLLE